MEMDVKLNKKMKKDWYGDVCMCVNSHNELVSIENTNWNKKLNSEVEWNLKWRRKKKGKWTVTWEFEWNAIAIQFDGNSMF